MEAPKPNYADFPQTAEGRAAWEKAYDLWNLPRLFKYIEGLIEEVEEYNLTGDHRDSDGNKLPADLLMRSIHDLASVQYVLLRERIKQAGGN